MPTKRLLQAFLCILFIWAGTVHAANKDKTVMVIPSRYTVIQLAYDISKLRTSTIIAYEPVENTKIPATHIWDKMANDWMKMSIAEFGSGDFPGADAEVMVIMGIDGEVPDVLVQAASWCPTIREVEEISIVDMVNTLNKNMDFSPREWKWIADKYRLKLKDKNAKRRRYGKYGPPGQETPEPSKKPDKVMRIPMPEPAGEPVKPIEPVKPEIIIGEPGPPSSLPEPKELKELEDIRDIAPEDK